MTAALLEHFCASDDRHWQTAEDAAVAALNSRLRPWDAIAGRLA